MSNFCDGNSSAHPIEPDYEAGVGREYGLTKREEFAKAAMQGLLAPDPNPNFRVIAGCAVKQADELIKALNGQ